MRKTNPGSKPTTSDIARPVTPTLKPCPFCGSTKLDITGWTDGSTRWVDCNECAAEGPAAPGDFEAANEWNAALRPEVPRG